MSMPGRRDLADEPVVQLLVRVPTGLVDRTLWEGMADRGYEQEAGGLWVRTVEVAVLRDEINWIRTKGVEIKGWLPRRSMTRS